MRFLGWMLCFALSNVYAQEVIENTPLSVEDDGTRQIVERPADGQLKLEPTPAPAPAVTPAATPAPAPVSEDKAVAITFYEERLSRYLQYSFGYLNSRYEKIHTSLDNGSILNSFRFVGDLNQNFQSGFAVEFLSDTSGQTIPDNIRSIQYRLLVDYHAPMIERMVVVDWLLGMALVAGDYGVRRRYLNDQGQEVSVKMKGGTILGLIPSAGVRFYLVDKSSFDLVVEYHQYFGKPQSYIGGLAFAPRLSFEF